MCRPRIMVTSQCVERQAYGSQHVYPWENQHARAHGSGAVPCRKISSREHHPQHIRLARTERHADSHLGRSLGDGQRSDSVKTERSKKGCETRERDAQHSHKPARRHRLVDHFLHGLVAGDGDPAVQLPDRTADVPRRRPGIGRRPNNQGNFGRIREPIREIDQPEWKACFVEDAHRCRSENRQWQFKLSRAPGQSPSRASASLPAHAPSTCGPPVSASNTSPGGCCRIRPTSP
jgi:hypothetical protein